MPSEYNKETDDHHAAEEKQRDARSCPAAPEHIRRGRKNHVHVARADFAVGVVHLHKLPLFCFLVRLVDAVEGIVAELRWKHCVAATNQTVGLIRSLQRMAVTS